VVAAGTTLIREGDVGDAYYVVSSGAAEVRRADAVLARLGRHEGAGETALLTDAPRNATVVTVEPSVVLVVDREPFLLAVTGHDGAAAAAWREAERRG